MITRMISAVVGLVLLIVFLILGGLPLKIALILLALLAMIEMKRAFGVSYRLDDLLSAIFLTIIFFIPTDLALATIFSYLVISLVLQMFFLGGEMQSVIARFFCFSYIAIPMYLLWRLIAFGPQRLYLLVFLVAWVCDTAAYFVGTFFGSRKLAPHISPKKTVEGLLGGVVASVIVSVIFKLIFLPYASFIGVFFFALFGAVVAVLGDLLASYMKRERQIKDFGFLMPGHGGVMDRFDSVLPVIVLLYLMLGSIV